jgi:hypothetical protein
VSKPTDSGADSSAIQGLANQMAATGKTQQTEGATLFNMALPGLEQSEGYYGKLASGDPQALSRANAPAIASITQQSNAAKKNIAQDNPRGGERNLAMEEADLSKGAQIGNLTSSSYANSFGSLAGLGGQNVSQGAGLQSSSVQAAGAASNQYQGLLQNNAQSKASTLGLFGSLAGAGAEAYAAH